MMGATSKIPAGVLVALGLAAPALAAADYEPYNRYIAQSNQLCKPNY